MGHEQKKKIRDGKKKGGVIINKIQKKKKNPTKNQQKTKKKRHHQTNARPEYVPHVACKDEKDSTKFSNLTAQVVSNYLSTQNYTQDR